MSGPHSQTPDGIATTTAPADGQPAILWTHRTDREVVVASFSIDEAGCMVPFTADGRPMAELAHRVERYVRQVLGGRVRWEILDDILQNTWVRLLGDAGLRQWLLSGRDNAGSFVRRIAWNLFLDLVRSVAWKRFDGLDDTTLVVALDDLSIDVIWDAISGWGKEVLSLREKSGVACALRVQIEGRLLREDLPDSDRRSLKETLKGSLSDGEARRLDELPRVINLLHYVVIHSMTLSAICKKNEGPFKDDFEKRRAKIRDHHKLYYNKKRGDGIANPRSADALLLRYLVERALIQR